MSPTDTADTPLPQGSALEVLRVATKLGLTSFGGPIAHLGYFRAEYVERRKWIDERAYADLVALCQFLPGPASSQVGIGIGMLRAGVLGGVLAWIGFTLPSALVLLAFALAMRTLDVQDAGWLHGLKIVAVAVVAQAVWGMARNLAPDRPRATIAILAAIAVLAVPTALAQVAVIVGAGLVGWRLFDAGNAADDGVRLHVPVPRWLMLTAWVLFFGLLVLLPVARSLVHSQTLAVVDTFYRVGSLVFGGGHVVLPLIRAEVVPSGWVTPEAFIAGYGATQAMPGPLFTFAAYLGAVMRDAPNGVAGAAVALLAIFAPSFLLMLGALPLWDALRRRGAFQAALRGVNAGVVGILGAALYTPVWTSAIGDAADVTLALAAFGLLQVWHAPPWLVVLLTAAGGAGLAALG